MSLISRASRFARSPQGRRAVDQAKRFAEKPESKRKLEQLRGRLARKG